MAAGIGDSSLFAFIQTVHARYAAAVIYFVGFGVDAGRLAVAGAKSAAVALRGVYDGLENPHSASFVAYRPALCSLTAPIGCPTMTVGIFALPPAPWAGRAGRLLSFCIGWKRILSRCLPNCFCRNCLHRPSTDVFVPSIISMAVVRINGRFMIVSFFRVIYRRLSQTAVHSSMLSLCRSDSNSPGIVSNALNVICCNLRG